MTDIQVPELGLVVLVGVSGAGKSYFARKHFTPPQVVSSDQCRALVADDENDQSATDDAFDLLHHIVRTRLHRGLLTVVDATNVQPKARQALVEIAKGQDVLSVAIVLDVPESVAIGRNAARPDRDLPAHVVPRQRRELRRGLRGLGREFKRSYVLRGVEEIDAATISYEKAWTDKKEITGPFDIFGDVHGCRAELERLLTALGYELSRDGLGRPDGGRHPDGRTAVFVGDLVDRGPDTPGVLRLVMGMAAAGTALCVSGNHEAKLVRALQGRKVKVSHGLAESLKQLEAEPAGFRAEALRFMDGLISHYVLDGGRLVVAHAGLKEAYHGRASARVRSFALYGDTTGETDEYGLPIRYPWAKDYRGRAIVVYGHTPIPEPEWVNNTICLDTGCVFGGKLSALRYPERELVAESAQRVWYPSARPFDVGPAVTPGARRETDVLNIDDVLGVGGVDTRLLGRVTVRDENAMAALEVMSRFVVDPRWLVYLPPTMAPAGSSALDGHLEHPVEALAAYRNLDLQRVVCEEKHMGSRVIVVVCRTPDVAATRFGVDDGSIGAVYTRTGRPFFDVEVTSELLDRVRDAVEAAGLWTELSTGWLALDGELMPWSAKATELIRSQYAATGAAARVALPTAAAALALAADRGLDVGELRAHIDRRAVNAALFRDAYARFCWPVAGLSGVRLALFQLLPPRVGACTPAPTFGIWRSRTGWPRPIRSSSPRLGLPWPTRPNPTPPSSGGRKLTAGGGEGMVVKPLGDLPSDKKVQPGLKCRGREYLRIIYGPDYLDHLNLLRSRSLGRKRSLALREHALGVEALDRLVAGEPLWRIHQAVFAVLALESEPVDPRL